MHNPETQHLLENEYIKQQIEQHTRVMHDREHLGTRYYNLMFGLEDGELNPEETEDWEKTFLFVGQKFLRQLLTQNQYKNVDEVESAIKEHTEKYAKFGAHDLVHVIIENSLEQPANPEKLHMPEFIKPEVNQQQAIRDELSAVIWTPIHEKGSVFIDLIQDRAEAIKTTIAEHYNSAESSEIISRLDHLDHTDFRSITHTYAEVVFYLARIVAMREAKDRMSGQELEKWDKQYRADEDMIRKSVYRQIEDFMNNAALSTKDKGEKTEQLFIHTAFEIFTKHPSDKKIAHKILSKLAAPLLAKAE